jgi:ribose-phosphate pyrophosphokinase
MNLSLIAGSSNIALAEATANCMETPLSIADVAQFPDSEQHVQLRDSVRGADVFILQATSPPVDSNLVELLFLCNAARRAGAERVTAVVPYFGYARQDRRARGREALAARLAADMIVAAGADRCVGIDVHGRTFEGFFSIPLEHLSAVPLLVQRVQQTSISGESVVVAPDLGAVKLAEVFAQELNLPVAVVRKARVSGSEVSVAGVMGDVRGRIPIIVDDMISTGATIRAAAEALVGAGARSRIIVAATHGLFVGTAAENLSHDWLERIIVSDSIPQSPHAGLQVETVSVAPLLAEAIAKLHTGTSLAGLIKYE